uniref:V-SNARE coiled-coil homology domain-containing protein n=1 Tax=Caenorhabditis japonica TaxID=281687 RepID=A0A8R1I0E6_CAEJA
MIWFLTLLTLEWTVLVTDCEYMEKQEKDLRAPRYGLFRENGCRRACHTGICSLRAKVLKILLMENGKGMKSDQQNGKINTIQDQVESVKAIMVENVDRILERGQQLDDIERRTEQLNATSATFQTTARRVKKKFCMLNAKWTIILSVVILVVFVVLLILILHWCGVIGKNDNK